MDYSEFEDMVAAYAIGALDIDDRKRFELLLDAKGGLSDSLVSEIRLVVTSLLYSVLAREPSNNLKRKIVGAIEEEHKRGNSDES